MRIVGSTRKLEEEGTSKERYVNLISGVNVILNGRKITENIDAAFIGGNGEVVFVDDDEHSGCETVYINKYSYLTVQNVDFLGYCH